MFIPYPLTTYHLLGAVHYLSFYQSSRLKGIPNSSQSLIPAIWGWEVQLKSETMLKVKGWWWIKSLKEESVSESRARARLQLHTALKPKCAARIAVQVAHACSQSCCKYMDTHWSQEAHVASVHLTQMCSHTYRQLSLTPALHVRCSWTVRWEPTQ